MKLIANIDNRYYLENQAEADELRAKFRYKFRGMRGASKMLGINEVTLHRKMKIPKDGEHRGFFTYGEIKKLNDAGIEIKIH